MIINGKNFYDREIDSNIKRYQEIRNLTTGQGEDGTTESLSEHDYIKNHYRLIAVDLSRQKELDADPTDAGDNDQSMFVLTILEKIKETRLNFSQGSVTVL